MAASMCRSCSLCFRHKIANFLQTKTPMVQICRLESDMKVNHNLVLDPRLEMEENKPKWRIKNHPGIVNVKRAVLPERLQEAISILEEKYPTQDLLPKSMKLYDFLWSRHVPLEEKVINESLAKHERNILAKGDDDLSQMDEDELQQYKAKVKQRVLSTMRFHTYHWEPIKYDAPTGFLYLKARMAMDYSVFYRIFNEMVKRDPEFSPRTVFDFGSGVGSSVWAVNSHWKGQRAPKEHFCYDPSSEMNTIARLLLQGGEEVYEMCIPGVYFRVTFPISSKNMYDLVTSAFTLLELPSQAERLKWLLAMWRKTEKYLVLVEVGTNAGFELINEARDFILQLGDEASNIGSSEEEEKLKGHVFAPCPHDYDCPRVAMPKKRPCNFSVDYFAHEKRKENPKSARFSYLVLKKGPRDPEEDSWPRLVQQVDKIKKSIHCRSCTKQGELEYSVITGQRHGKLSYQVAKACGWGDLLPMNPGSAAEEKLRRRTAKAKKDKAASSQDPSSTVQGESTVQRAKAGQGDTDYISENKTNQESSENEPSDCEQSEPVFDKSKSSARTSREDKSVPNTDAFGSLLENENRTLDNTDNPTSINSEDDGDVSIKDSR